MLKMWPISWAVVLPTAASDPKSCTTPTDEVPHIAPTKAIPTVVPSKSMPLMMCYKNH